MKINAQARLLAANFPKEVRELGHYAKRSIAFRFSRAGVDLNSSRNIWKRVNSYSDLMALAKKHKDDYFVVICIREAGNEFTRNTIENYRIGRTTISLNYLVLIPVITNNRLVLKPLEDTGQYYRFSDLGRTSYKKFIEDSDYIYLCLGTDEDAERVEELIDSRSKYKPVDFIRRTRDEQRIKDDPIFTDKSGYDKASFKSRIRYNPEEVMKTNYPEHF